VRLRCHERHARDVSACRLLRGARARCVERDEDIDLAATSSLASLGTRSSLPCAERASCASLEHFDSAETASLLQHEMLGRCRIWVIERHRADYSITASAALSIVEGSRSMSAMGHPRAYSMTWVAPATTDAGISIPRAFAVLRLMARSNFIRSLN
jgi:hypothetical protein